MIKNLVKLEEINMRFPIIKKDKKLINFFFKKKKESDCIDQFRYQNLKVSFNSGEIVGLTGHNGSGKTTLLKIIAGIYKPDNGKVVLNGNVSPILGQLNDMDLDLSGYDNIFLMSYLRGYSNQNVKENIKNIINYSELEDKIWDPVRTYSTGMIMRLISATLLILKSDIIVIDEFIVSLDENYLKKVKAELIRKKNNGGLIIIASHYHSFLKSIASRMISLDKGKIIKDEKIN